MGISFCFNRRCPTSVPITSRANLSAVNTTYTLVTASVSPDVPIKGRSGLFVRVTPVNVSTVEMCHNCHVVLDVLHFLYLCSDIENTQLSTVFIYFFNLVFIWTNEQTSQPRSTRDRRKDLWPTMSAHLLSYKQFLIYCNVMWKKCVLCEAYTILNLASYHKIWHASFQSKLLLYCVKIYWFDREATHETRLVHFTEVLGAARRREEACRVASSGAAGAGARPRVHFPRLSYF